MDLKQVADDTQKKVLAYFESDGWQVSSKSSKTVTIETKPSTDFEGTLYRCSCTIDGNYKEMHKYLSVNTIGWKADWDKDTASTEVLEQIDEVSKGTCPHLLGQTILVVSSRDEFVEAWSSILALAKCHLPTRFPTRAVKADPGIDFVISDLTCPTAIVRKCRNLDVPLVSSEWVAQCLINNALVDPTTHDKYKHDYGS